jgi:L-asparaginase II
MRMSAFEPAIEVTRGGTVESIHAAAIAVTDPSGRILHALGDPTVEIVMRSAAKPFQAVTVLASGAAGEYGFTEGEIALIAGSHGGEEAHQATAASILSKAGLLAAALKCGCHVPFSRDAAREIARQGLDLDPLMNNCSGKHAGMLAACRIGGLPEESYLDPGHPVQRRNLESVALFTGRAAETIGIGVDGCSAPTFMVGLHELATGFAKLAEAPGAAEAEDSPRRLLARVADAMRAHPEMVAGDGMLDTALMRAVPGLVAKVGADGIHAMGWPSPCGPIGMAVKIMDGDVGRGRMAAVMALLAALGALGGEAGLPDSLTWHRSIHNHRRIDVGEVRPVFTLRRGG